MHWPIIQIKHNKLAWPKREFGKCLCSCQWHKKLCSLPEQPVGQLHCNTSSSSLSLSPFRLRPNPIRNACHLRLERNGSRTNAERENPFGAYSHTHTQTESACWKISSVKIAYVSAFASAKCVCEEEETRQDNNTKFLYKICGYFLMGLKLRKRCN